MSHLRQATQPAPKAAGPPRPGLTRALSPSVNYPVRQWSLDIMGAAGEIRLQQQVIQPASSSSITHDRRFRASHPPSLSTIAWKNCLRKLTDSERNLFKNNQITSIEELLASAQSAAKTQEEKDRIFRIAKKFKPLMHTVNLYAGVADTMVQANPAPAALALGGINCLLSIPGRFVEYQEKISEKLFEMGRQFQNLQKYQDEVYEDEPDIDDALIQVYIDIVEFCREAAKLLFDRYGKPRKTINVLVKSTFQSFDYKLDGMAKKFEADLRYFEKSVEAVFRRNEARFQKVMTQGMGDVNQNTMGTLQIVGNLEASFGMMVQRRHIERDSLDRIQEEWKKQILAWLPKVDFQADQKNIFQQRLEGTGQWLLVQEKFKEWTRESSNGELPPNILCVQGKAGCGKSYLAALVVDELSKNPEERADQIAVGYAYCSKLDAAKSNPVRILSSITKQILDQNPEFGFEALQRIFDNWQEKSSPTEDQLQEAISAMSNKFKKLFIIIDGLDECHGQGEKAFVQFCTTLRNIAHARPAVIRLIIFSRPGYTQIENAFRSDPHIQVDSGNNDGDILQYVLSMTSGQELLVRSNPQLLEIVKETLSKKADGMFLWVGLIIQRLKNARTKNQLMSIINSLPRGLDEAYDQALHQILAKTIGKDLCLRILLWVCNAKRPLSSEELKTALQIKAESFILDDEYFIESEDGITAECGDLIIIRDGHYHLLHSSLQDYLTKLELEESVKISEYRQLQSRAHKLIGTACITYLLFDEFRKVQLETKSDVQNLLERHPFLAYAASCLGHHIISAGEEEFGPLIRDFVNCEPARELCITLYHYFRSTKDSEFPTESSTTPLHALSMFNLIKTADAFLESLQLRNDLDQFEYLPIDYALAERSQEMCLWLLQNDLNSKQYPKPTEGRLLPIHMATVHDWGDAVKVMVSLGFSPEKISADSRRTPLHEAASEGCQNALLALLAFKVDVNAEDVDKQTALLEAVEADHHAVVVSLLQAGAKINHRGWASLTALHHAAITGNLETAQLLVEWKAEIDACADAWGNRTPLHVASENNHPSIIQLLVDQKADIDKQCSDNFTPLLFAASTGSLEAIALLLKLNANPFLRTDEEETPLHLAAGNGNFRTVKLLLEAHPSLLKLVDDCQNTALHTALKNQETKIALFLLKNGSPVEAADNKNQTPLHLAVMHNLEEMIEPLISEYQADRTKRGLFGSSPLHYAAQFGYSHLIEPLVANSGVDPEDLNDDQQGVLHFAARTKNFEFVTKLVDLLPGINLGILDKWHQTPLHLAAKAGSSELVRYFSQDHQMCKIPDSDKNLPLHIAAWNGHLDCVQLLLTKDSVNTKGFCSRTALFGAATRGYIDVVKALLEWDANPNIVDEFGRGPLVASLKAKQVDIAKLLLLRMENRAVPYACDKWQSTPLHQAAQAGDKDLVKLLFDFHCDGLAEDHFGVTPFFCAVLADDINMVDLFLERNLNGCSISTARRVYAFQIAAAKGNLTMFQKLFNAGKSVGVDVFASDLLGNTVMCDAAASGEPDFLPVLTEIGLSIDGLEGAYRVPLIEAATNGNIRFLVSLLERKPKLNNVTEFGFTAICSAAAENRLAIFHLLLEAGADPLIRNIYGYNALDYARFHPQLWDSIDESLRNSYQPLGDFERLNILRNTAIATAEAILKLSPVLTPEVELERLRKMLVLGNVCMHLGTDSSNSDAIVCHTEFKNLLDGSVFCAFIRCAICMEEPISGPMFICTHPGCFDTDLCEKCYLDWVKGSDTPKSIPPGARKLEALESELRPIRDAVKTLARMGAEIAFDALDLLVPIKEWFEKKLNEYRDWEEQYNDEGRFKARDIPGRDFMEIMAKVKEIQTAESEDEDLKRAGDTANITTQEETTHLAISEDDNTTIKSSREAKMNDLNKKLDELFNKCRPDKEIPDFTCCGHERINVPVVNWAEEDTRSGPFDDRGRITNVWLQEFIERYRSEEPRVTDSELTDEPLELQEDAPASLLAQEQDSNNSLLITTPAQADALFKYNDLLEKATAKPTNLEPTPGLQSNSPAMNMNLINVETARRETVVNRPPISQKETMDKIEQVMKPPTTLSREPRMDWLEQAIAVPLPISRQGTFDSLQSTKAVKSKSTATEVDSIKNGNDTKKINDFEVEASNLDLETTAKLERVGVIYRELRKLLADRAVATIQALSAYENNGDENSTAGHAVENHPRTDSNISLNSADNMAVYIKIFTRQCDAAFDVLQFIWHGQQYVDLVPGYDLKRLLEEEGRLVNISEENIPEQSEQVEPPAVQPDTVAVNGHVASDTIPPEQVQPASTQPHTISSESMVPPPEQV